MFKEAVGAADRQSFSHHPSSHDEPERPGSGADGGLLPHGAGHGPLGLREVQAGAE